MPSICCGHIQLHGQIHLGYFQKADGDGLLRICQQSSHQKSGKSYGGRCESGCFWDCRTMRFFRSAVFLEGVQSKNGNVPHGVYEKE